MNGIIERLELELAELTIERQRLGRAIATAQAHLEPVPESLSLAYDNARLAQSECREELHAAQLGEESIR